MSNTPSDAEIISVMRDGYNCRYNDEADHVDFARAVLAKWGTPQQDVQEPFCYVSVNKQGDITRTMKRKDKWTNIPLYTTPQPAKVQPVVLEPLTDEQIDVVMRKALGYGLSPSRDDLELVRAIERAHGIKGGQHGAE